MPYVRRTPATRRSQCDDLRRELEDELRHAKATGQPIILEDETTSTKSIRIYVIWDRWKECDSEARTDVIRSVYQNVRGEDIANQITLAIGVTMREAITMGLLPYQVVPTRRKDDSISDERYRNAMTEAGAADLGGVLQLRFSAYEDAEACYERLLEAVPGSKWVIQQEVYAADE